MKTASGRLVNPALHPSVQAVFDSYPPALCKKLLALRQLILDTAAITDGVGALEETLKWGEPAYVTTQSKSGSTVRIDRKKTKTATPSTSTATPPWLTPFAACFQTAFSLKATAPWCLMWAMHCPKKSWAFVSPWR